MYHDGKQLLLITRKLRTGYYEHFKVSNLKKIQEHWKASTNLNFLIKKRK